jgi:hypothetical protein
MLVERIDEAVKVRADFQGGIVTPCRFRLRQQDVQVARVNVRWEDREGQDRLYYFSVTSTTGDTYELHLATRNMIWYVDRVFMEG